jgi:ribonuclease E
LFAKLSTMIGGLFGSKEEEAPKTKPATSTNSRPSSNRPQNKNRNNSRGRNNPRNNNDRRPNNRNKVAEPKEKAPVEAVTNSPEQAVEKQAPVRKSTKRRPTRDAQTGRVNADEVGANRKTRGDSKNASKRVKPAKPESIINEIDFEMLGKAPAAVAKAAAKAEENAAKNAIEATQEEKVAPVVEVQETTEADTTNASETPVIEQPAVEEAVAENSAETEQKVGATEVTTSSATLADSPEPQVAHEPITEVAAPTEPVEAVVAAEESPEESSKTEDSTEEASIEDTSTVKPEKKRAANDPREVKRRQMAEAKESE